MGVTAEVGTRQGEELCVGEGNGGRVVDEFIHLEDHVFAEIVSSDLKEGGAFSPTRKATAGDLVIPLPNVL